MHSCKLLSSDSNTERIILDFLLYFGYFFHRGTELLIVIYSTDLRRPSVYNSAQSAALGGGNNDLFQCSFLWLPVNTVTVLIRDRLYC